MNFRIPKTSSLRRIPSLPKNVEGEGFFGGAYDRRGKPRLKRRPPFILVLWIALWGCILLAGSNCRAQDREMNLPGSLETSTLEVKTGGGALIAVKAEIARTEEARSLGLMNRRSLNDGEGMLFVFDRDRILSFWMKNTLIPLSIAYINSQGRILEIYDLRPQNLTSVVSTRSARYALEVPQGWFERAGIAPGDMITLP